MGTQQSKADHASETEHQLERAQSGDTLGIRFFPVVAFAVSCKPAETRPADKHREGSRSSMNGTCRLAANVRPGTSAVPGNASRPGSVVTKGRRGRPARIEHSKPHTIEHENKWEEILTCPGQGAALEDGKGPHSDRGTWENVGPLQDAKGSAPNAKDPNEPDRQHGSLPEDQRGAVGGE